MSELEKLANRYANAWCSQNPESVASFFSERGSLSVNEGTPAAESKGHFDAAEYERQLAHGVDV